MPFKIDIGKGVKRMIDKKLLSDVREEFSKKGPLKVKRAIINDVRKGISPVHGKGKFKKYSKSYKDVIRNKAAYRTNSRGQVYRISPTNVGRKGKGNVRQKVRDLNRDYHDAARPMKQVSPVNMRHTGKLHKALKVFTKGGFLSTYRLVFDWRHWLANIHNEKGAGKSKVIRRLMPTKPSEKFNRNITGVLMDELKKAVNTVAKRLS